MPSQESTSNSEETLSKVYKDFQSSVKHPEIYLSIQPKKEEKFKIITKNLYDTSTKFQDKPEHDPNVLPELILDSMDEEQIWQQLELRNNRMLSKFLKDTSRLLTLNRDALSIKCRTAEDSSEEESNVSHESEQDENQQNDNYFDSEEQSDEEEDESPALTSTKKTKKSGKKQSIVDDKFFKLSEMEEFLKTEDDKETLKQKGKPVRDEEIDYFEDEESDDEDEEDLKYSDFFDQEDEDESKSSDLKKRSNKRKYSEDNALEEVSEQEPEGEDNDGEEEASETEESDDEQNLPLNQKSKQSDQSSEEYEEGENDLPKSSFEARQERLRQRIKEHEEKALGEKPWQLKGEITAVTRPKNSLLEEILEFDSTIRPAPVITEETTLRLEDIIRQRIKDKAWDDVERKFRPVKTPLELRKRLVLDQEKSKESLAQIYEKEYHNQIDKLNPNDEEERIEEPESHKEIKKLMRALFVKLDALSNFHYTPKPAIPELRIITNTPAIELEEVAPVAVSSAKLLAPEEVRDRAKGDVLGKSERERTDKNRERRKKKMKQKIIGKIKEQKLEEKQKMGLALTTKEEKSKMMKSVLKHRNVQKMSGNDVDGSAPKSSKAFFTQLQDKVSSGKEVKVKKKAPKDQVSAKRLKL